MHTWHEVAYRRTCISSLFLFSSISHMSMSLMPGLMKLCEKDRTCRCTSAAMRTLSYRSASNLHSIQTGRMSGIHGQENGKIGDHPSGKVLAALQTVWSEPCAHCPVEIDMRVLKAHLSCALFSSDVIRKVLKSPGCSISSPLGYEPTGNRLATGMVGGSVWPYFT